MKKLFFAILIASSVSVAITAMIARDHYVGSTEEKNVTAHVLESRVLSEKRELLVYLPESYEKNVTRRYPVLYVLDGASQAAHTAESARLMARIGAIPDLIVVGLPNMGDEKRQRDYTPPYMPVDAEAKNGESGGGNRFLRFLETELIPHIDRQYRTTATRMLAGSSRGGLFVVYSFIEKPELFTARFAYSPALWRNDDRIIAELAKSLDRRAAGSSFLYLSLGDRENEKMTRAFRKASDVLRASASSGLRWRADVTSGASHQDNALLSTPVGLHTYYRASTARAEASSVTENSGSR